MSSKDFLQRFKGKTQTVGKQGLAQVFGAQPKGTHNKSSSLPEQNNPPRTSTNYQKSSQVPNKNKLVPPIQSNQKNNKLPSSNAMVADEYNPFLVSNPFYYDEQDKQRHQKQLQEQRKKKMQQKKRKQQQMQSQINNNKASKTQTSIKRSTMKSMDHNKPTSSKEWVMLGGLGANIGGQQWLQKKKKLQKMQEFASQVKSVNAKIPPRAPQQQQRKQQQKKEPNNARDKALQYSKHVPKPVIKQSVPDLDDDTTDNTYLNQAIHIPGQPDSSQLSQLQLYMLRHQQLKNKVKNSRI